MLSLGTKLRFLAKKMIKKGYTVKDMERYFREGIEEGLQEEADYKKRVESEA